MALTKQKSRHFQVTGDVDFTAHKGRNAADGSDAADLVTYGQLTDIIEGSDAFVKNQFLGAQLASAWLSGNLRADGPIFGYGGMQLSGGLVQDGTTQLLGLSGAGTRVVGANETGILSAGSLVSDLLVTSGSYSNPSWIASLAWNKINGTPTTLAGYGITDGVGKSGSLTSGRIPVVTTGGVLTDNSSLIINTTNFDINHTAAFRLSTANNQLHVGFASSFAGAHPNGFTGIVGDVFNFGNTVSPSSRFFRLNNSGNATGVYGAVASNNDLMLQLNAVTNSIFRISAQSQYTDLIQSSNGEFQMLNPAAGNRLIVGTTGSGGELRLFNSFGGFLTGYTGNAERFRITAGGNFLIGTTTDAGYKFQVSGTSYLNGTLNTTGTSTMAGNIQLYNGGAGWAYLRAFEGGFSRMHYSGLWHKFLINDVEKAGFDPGGNFYTLSGGKALIGTTTDNSAGILQTAGNIVPSVNNTYNIGSSIYKWKEGHFEDVFVGYEVWNGGWAGDYSVPTKSAIYEKWQGMFLSASDNLDFPETAPREHSDIDIAVAGATAGDVVVLGVDSAAVMDNTCYTAWVSADDTVTVRFNNYSNANKDPESGNFKILVIKQ